MAEVLYLAIPFFVLLFVVEALSFRHDHGELVGYEFRDTRTSLAMGLGNVFINAVWKFGVLAAYTAVYELTPLRLPASNPLTWVALFFADDLAYYWFHRISHESRVFWASHVVHHSSQHYNLSTALRQTWVPMTYFPFWLWMPAVGFAPWMVLLAQSWSLIYQFFLHTERVKTSAAWLIERAGFHKGDTRGSVGISTKHSLALINRGGATTAELVAFAREIADGVRERFGVALHPEPIFVGHDWR